MSNGLLEDLLGWAKENLENAGKSFGQSLERDRQVIDAYRGRRQVDPEKRAEMIDEYINHANPMGAVGGMIKPSTWAKYTPEAKAEMTQLANRFPQAFKEKVLDTPKDIYTTINSELPANVGGRFKPGYVISSSLDAPARIMLNPKHIGTGQSNRILEHELIHNVNDVTKRVTNTDPDDAWTLARLLQSKLPSEVRGSLDRVIAENTTPTKIMDSANPWDAAMERVTNAWDSRTLNKQGPISHSFGGWAGMDEGLAHLSQAASMPNATPEIRKLARDMGVSWEDKTKEVLFGGKNSPKWNPRDVSMPPRTVESSVDIPRDKVSQGALELFNNLKQRLGLDARFRHGTGPEEAVGIIKEGLRPGSSISKRGGLDYEGYPVVFEFDDSLKGAKDYGSPLGPTMHKGAATTGETAQNIKKVFFDPDEFSYKEDALDVFRKLRESLNESGRKDLKIESARWDDAADKWRYGGTPSLKNLKSFADHVKKAPNLDRLFNETMDNLDRVPAARKPALEKRIDAILEEMYRRNPKDATFGKFRGPTERSGSDMLNVMERHANDLRQNALNITGDTEMYGVPTSKDSVVAEVLNKIARKLGPTYRAAAGTNPAMRDKGGVSGIRKSLGNMLPLSDVDPRDAMKLNDFKALMQHLDKYGMFNNWGPGSIIDQHINRTLTPSQVKNPDVLRRLKRFIEETKD